MLDQIVSILSAGANINLSFNPGHLSRNEQRWYYDRPFSSEIAMLNCDCLQFFCCFGLHLKIYRFMWRNWKKTARQIPVLWLPSYSSLQFSYSNALESRYHSKHVDKQAMNNKDAQQAPPTLMFSTLSVTSSTNANIQSLPYNIERRTKHT
jgi:hypothetical protein